MSPRTAPNANEQQEALRALLYEMLMLASSFVTLTQRAAYEKFDDLDFGPAQIAYETMQLKSRLLSDFLKNRVAPPNNDDIVISDFGEAGNNHDHLTILREGVNKWSAHLTWQRIRKNNPDAPQPDRTALKAEILNLLDEADGFVTRQLVAGLRLPPLGEKYRRAYKKLRNQLGSLPGPASPSPSSPASSS